MVDDQGSERNEAEAADPGAPPPAEVRGAGAADEAETADLGAPPPAEVRGAGAADEAETAAEAQAATVDASPASSPPSADTDALPVPATPPADAVPAVPTRRRASLLWWALPILMVVEFYVYGHDGRLEICVGKEGDTDFSLVGQERNDSNRWKFPRCELRENLGLRSQRDAKVKEGLEAACRGATIFRHQGEAKACLAAEQGWQHQVEGHFVPPWDPAYYRHLFWFLQ